MRHFVSLFPVKVSFRSASQIRYFRLTEGEKKCLSLRFPSSRLKIGEISYFSLVELK